MGEAHAFDVLVVGGGATGAGVLRDLARRGLRTLLVERGDYGTGTTGRYHGLLHSGGRYVAKDALAARECISENRILRRIAPASIEDTGGLFVATPEDPDDYVAGFEAACNAADVDCEEIPVAEALRREPALNPRIRRAFKLPDGSVEPWQLIESNIADARAHGSEAWSYQRLVGMDRDGSRIVGATLRDERSGQPDAHRAPVRRLVRGCVGGPDRRDGERHRDDAPGQGHDAHLQPADDRHGGEPLPQVVRWRHHGPGPHRRDPRDHRAARRGPRSLRDHARGGRGADLPGRGPLPGPRRRCACCVPTPVCGRSTSRPPR